MLLCVWQRFGWSLVVYVVFFLSVYDDDDVNNNTPTSPMNVFNSVEFWRTLYTYENWWKKAIGAGGRLRIKSGCEKTMQLLCKCDNNNNLSFGRLPLLLISQNECASYNRQIIFPGLLYPVFEYVLPPSLFVDCLQFNVFDSSIIIIFIFISMS